MIIDMMITLMTRIGAHGPGSPASRQGLIAHLCNIILSRSLWWRWYHTFTISHYNIPISYSRNIILQYRNIILSRSLWWQWYHTFARSYYNFIMSYSHSIILQYRDIILSRYHATISRYHTLPTSYKNIWISYSRAHSDDFEVVLCNMILQHCKIVKLLLSSCDDDNVILGKAR